MAATRTAPPTDPFATEERRALREVATRFTVDHVLPHLDDWERRGLVPRDLHVEAARAGLLGLGFDPAVGGEGGDVVEVTVVHEAMIEAGATSGLMAALFTHGIALPHMARHGGPELVDRWVRPTLRGELLGSLAITEPGGGSDVNHLTTRARREGDHLVLDGAKTYITSAVRADFLTVAARTGGPGAGGISLVVVPTDADGVTVSGPLDKLGWRCSDTGEVHLDGVVVPAGNVVGEVDGGFAMIGECFVDERLNLATQAYATGARVTDVTARWVRERETFGRPLSSRQVVRHRLVEMRQRVEFARAYTRATALRHAAGEQVVAEACMAKNGAVAAGEFACHHAVQLHGGLGYMTGTEVERHYRDVRLLGIGGGANEVLSDLAAKLLGHA